ncbi:hypothetical protein PUN28_003657 [Cardiocondyla obscurior]|uniref:Ribosomal protein L20 n=1 Tax=Cardiocondyla obscurior TaxID=286306 RepID=A0AAW2GKE8_9HYME
MLRNRRARSSYIAKNAAGMDSGGACDWRSACVLEYVRCARGNHKRGFARQSRAVLASRRANRIPLPIKERVMAAIGRSREIAERRFCNLEKKFGRDAALKKKYVKFIDEYINGHRKNVSPDSIACISDALATNRLARIAEFPVINF